MPGHFSERCTLFDAYEETLVFALAKKMLGTIGAPNMAGVLDKIEDHYAKDKANLPKHIVLSSGPSHAARLLFWGPFFR